MNLKRVRTQKAAGPSGTRRSNPPVPPPVCLPERKVCQVHRQIRTRTHSQRNAVSEVYKQENWNAIETLVESVLIGPQMQQQTSIKKNDTRKAAAEACVCSDSISATTETKHTDAKFRRWPPDTVNAPGAKNCTL